MDELQRIRSAGSEAEVFPEAFGDALRTADVEACSLPVETRIASAVGLPILGLGEGAFDSGEINARRAALEAVQARCAHARPICDLLNET